MIEQTLLSKYEKQVETYINMLELSDKLLFDSLISTTSYLSDLASLVKNYAKEGNIGGIETSITELKKIAYNVEFLVKDAYRRAQENDKL